VAHNEIHVGDIGTVFTLTIKDMNAIIDISSATTLDLFLRKPSGKTLSRVCALATNGKDGKLKYTTIAGDMDEDGNWEIQAKVVLPSGTWYSDRGIFHVHANLGAD